MDNGLFDLLAVGASKPRDAGPEQSRRDRNDEDFGDLVTDTDVAADDYAAARAADRDQDRRQDDLRGDTAPPRDAPRDVAENSEVQEPASNSSSGDRSVEKDAPDATAQTKPEPETAEAKETTEPAPDETTATASAATASGAANSAAPQQVVERLAATPPPVAPVAIRPTQTRGNDTGQPTALNLANAANAALQGDGPSVLVPPPTTDGTAAPQSEHPISAANASTNQPSPNANFEGLQTASDALAQNVTAQQASEASAAPSSASSLPLEPSVDAGANLVSAASGANPNGAAIAEAAHEQATATPSGAIITAAHSQTAQSRPNSIAAVTTSTQRPGASLTAASPSGITGSTTSAQLGATASEPTFAANADPQLAAVPGRSGDTAPDLAVFRETLATVLPDAAGAQATDAAKSAGRIVAAELTARPQLLHMALTDQVTIRIREAFDAGDSQVRIQLQPKELGRIDVRMEIAESGRMSAVVVAERADTLELLMRDARGLERALQQAGFDTDSNSLSFDLKGNDDQEGDENAGDEGGGGESASSEPVGQDDTVLDLTALLSGDPAARGLDIRV